MATAAPKPTRPIERLARAAAQCSVEASTYGKCIVADYNHVHKDKCLPEFSRLKQCYLAALKKDPRRSQSTRPGAGVT